MINSIISFSIKNKAVVALFTIALIISGIYSMTKVPVDALPDITNNQVLVITRAPNLSTEDIEQFITHPIELEMSNLPNVVEIRSVSRFGLSVVTIVFEEKAGTYLPRQLVSETLNKVKEEIPKGFGQPFMGPITTGLGEIYQYTLEIQPGYDSVYNEMDLRTIQDWIIKRQMAMVHGVIEVNSLGGKKKQYEVAINPVKLKSFGLTIIDVYKALEKNNLNTGGAYIEKNHQALFIRGAGIMRNMDEIKNTLVKNINGHPIFIKDIAKVKLGYATRYGAFTSNGKGETVGGIVMMLKGANSNDVIKNVKERIALIQKTLPEGIIIKPFIDRSKLIKSTTSTVIENLSIGALIVIFVLVLFLANVRGGLIVASVIPLSLLFAFIMMYAFGVWANLMSLGALDFGILVDGAVIIVESMIFYLHKKKLIGKVLPKAQRDKIAYESASKMMGSAFFGQLIILIVFIPILTLQGVEGKMFIPMALTFGFAILGVVILSLTYVPMMAATFLQPPKTNKITIGEKIINKIEALYSITYDIVVKYGIYVLLASFILFLAGIYTFSKMGAEFIPQLDEGDLAIQAILKPGTSLSETIKTTTSLEKILLKNFPDEVKGVYSRIGAAEVPTDPMPMEAADIVIELYPKGHWGKTKNKKELIKLMREKLNTLVGVNVEFSQPVELRFNELLTGVREDIAIKIYGDDLKILAEKAEEVSKLISKVKGAADIKVEATQGLPQITIKYNRRKLAQYGLTIDDINFIIKTAFAGSSAGYIYEAERFFDLVVRLDTSNRKNIEDIQNLFIPLPNGSQVPLKEVADIGYKPGLMQITRENTNRRTYVGVNVEDRDIKSVVEDIQKILDKKLKLPPGYYIRYGGTFENLERATQRLILVVPITLMLIFVMVFFAVKSIKQTLMIYVTVPFAIIGGVYSLYLRGMPFSISAGVGFIVLFGVAVLNGLVLINSFNDLRKNTDNVDMKSMIKKGTIRRIRPILLTAFTDIMGFLPMAISTSAGAEVQRPLATVVIGGMTTSTLLTLIILPLLYYYLEKPKNNNSNNVSFSPAFSVILIFGISSLFISNNAKAQSNITITQAINKAKENYPSIKIADLEIKKQKTLKASVYDMGKTMIYTGNEEIGNGATGVNTKIGIEQSEINIFAIPAKNKLINAEIARATISKQLSEAELTRMVSIAWFNVYRSKQMLALYSQIDTLYSNFLKFVEIKYKTQAISQVELLSAQAKYNELKLNIQQIKNEYKTNLIILNKYVGDSIKILDIDTSDVYRYETNFILSEDAYSNSPYLKYYSSLTDVAKQRWKVEQSNIFPKLMVGYKVQTIDDKAGFYGWEAGISVPLLFWTQTATSKAEKINYEATKWQEQQKQIELQTQFFTQLKNYTSFKQTINYYKTKSLPLANKQMQASFLEYKTGKIDYLQFIKSVEMAIEIKKQFITQQYEYFKTIINLKYLLGN